MTISVAELQEARIMIHQTRFGVGPCLNQFNSHLREAVLHELNRLISEGRMWRGDKRGYRSDQYFWGLNGGLRSDEFV